MNFYHLKYFYDSVTEGSVGKAAKKNLVSQSAVSQAIRRLEESLDCELLIHQKNRFMMTDAGRCVFEKCLAIFESVEGLRTEVNNTKNEFTGTISFATSQSIAIAVLPNFLREFKKKYPLIKPKFSLGKTSILKHWLEEREIDFAITLDDGDLKSFDKVVVRPINFIAVHSKKSTFVPKNSGFILTEARPETESLKKSYKNYYNKELPVDYEVGSWEVIKRLSIEGLGIGFIPDFVLKNEDKNRLCIMRHGSIPKIVSDICFIQNKGRPLSRLGSLFLSELQSYLI